MLSWLRKLVDAFFALVDDDPCLKELIEPDWTFW
jgi:hypothetical protein